MSTSSTLPLFRHRQELETLKERHRKELIWCLERRKQIRQAAAALSALNGHEVASSGQATVPNSVSLPASPPVGEDHEVTALMGAGGEPTPSAHFKPSAFKLTRPEQQQQQQPLQKKTPLRPRIFGDELNRGSGSGGRAKDAAWTELERNPRSSTARRHVRTERQERASPFRASFFG